MENFFSPGGHNEIQWRRWVVNKESKEDKRRDIGS